MATSDTRLRILTFPQQWDGQQLDVRILIAPFGNPLQALDPGLIPFAQAKLVLRAHLIPHADQLPAPANVTEQQLLNVATPLDTATVYQALATHLQVDPAAPSAYVPPTKMHVLKLLMPSYLEASGGMGPHTEFAVTDNRYICALADGAPPVPRPPQPLVPPKWDRVLAMAIRQPVLAERLGLIYTASVRPADPTFFGNGGWLYVSLDDTSDYFAASAAPAFLKCHGARIPPLRAAVRAPVFAPVLFPVRATPPAGSFDEMFRETELYSEGFARLVHAFQPDRADYLDRARKGERGHRPYEETGLKLGWDDEQIVIWLNRQITDDPRNNPTLARDTPLGVRGFRVDVRETTDAGDWHSLVRMQGAIEVGNVSLAVFDGEMAIELAPAQLQGQRDGEYWLSPYFTQWTGASLVAADDLRLKVGNAAVAPRVLSPVDDRAVPLRYGRSYDFRVRLTDLTGGGPKSDTVDFPPAAMATHRFRRYVPPGLPRVAEPVEAPDGTLTITLHRPLLGYPALVYTPLVDAEAKLLADAPQAQSNHRMAAWFDPDVTRVRIDVLVANLEFDPLNHPGPSPRRLLYTAFRTFDADPAQPLDLSIEFVDAPDLAQFPLPTASGVLRLPTARTVEFTITPIARRDPGMAPGVSDPVEDPILGPALLDEARTDLVYFGKHAARVGKSHTLTLRSESHAESMLFGEIPGVPFQCIFLQPGAAPDVHLEDVNAATGDQNAAPESAVQRLVRQLRLVQQESTLCAPAGRRMVFGASAAVRHVLSPEHATLTFAEDTVLSGVWLAAVPLRLQRDWSWDAVEDEGFRVFRSMNGGSLELVGRISPRRSLSATTSGGGALLQRSTTDLLFLDAIDPKPAPGDFPAEIDLRYVVVPQFRKPPQAPSSEWSGEIRVPMAAPPVQVPRVVSAGIALSNLERDGAYSKTAPRRQRLWIEFDEPVANPRDAYFARVTMYAPDPLLAGDDPAPPPGPLEPPLNVDAESIRVIIAEQTEDASGLHAMERLVPADDENGPTRHFLLSLPPSLSDCSPELFGLFVYEFRVGHADGWSTARARFGPPLRLAGVQHPAPALGCSVFRSPLHIRVSAPFAAPTAHGRRVQAEPPKSDLWALLYVQVPLADQSDWRNVLIGRTQLRFQESHSRGRGGASPHGIGYWDQGEIESWLDALGLPRNSPLSAIAIELLPEPGSPFADPLGKDLGQVRVLRTSPLTPVPAICLDG